MKSKKKSELNDFKLLVNQYLTAETKIEKKIFNDLLRMDDDRAWFSYYIMRSLGQLIMYSKVVKNSRKEHYTPNSDRTGSQIIAEYFNKQRNVEVKHSFTELTKNVFKHFSFDVLFETLFPFLNRKYYKYFENYFFDGLEYFNQVGKIKRIGNSRLGYVPYRSMYWNIKVGVKPIYITDEFAAELSIDTIKQFKDDKPRVKPKYMTFKAEWIKQCCDIDGVGTIKALRMSKVLCFIFNKRTKYYDNKIACLSFQTLSNLSGYCVRSLKTYIKELKENSLIYCSNYVLYTNYCKGTYKASKNFYCFPEDQQYTDEVVRKRSIKAYYKNKKSMSW